MKRSISILAAFSFCLILIIVFSFRSQRENSLKDLFEGSFYIGAALNLADVSGTEVRALPILKKHFNSISPENGLKWINVHPESDTYDFSYVDKYVALGDSLDAFVVGHTLVWHEQIPEWVFENSDGSSKTKAELLTTLESHIEKVMGRYRGKIHGWDVVNEAIEDDGEFRNTKWYAIAGVDYIKTAFRKAYQTDPNAELYYNDYSVFLPKKRAAILKLANEMRGEGIRIDGIGMQGHYMVNSPTIEEIEKGIVEIHEAGFKVMIIELDVDVLKRPKEAIGADLSKTYKFQEEFNPYVNGLPAEVETKLINRYRDIFSVFYKHRDKISRVTFWGIQDGESWLNNWPVKGRTNYPLLFDRNFKPKSQIMERINEVVSK